MNFAITLTDKHVNFDTLISITDVQRIRFICKIVDNKVINIKSIKFLTLAYGHYYMEFTEKEYTIRTNNGIQSGIIDLLNQNDIPEVRPSEDTWIDENSKGQLVDGYEYKFYEIKDFYNFFKNMLFQRATECEKEVYDRTTLAMFLQDHINKLGDCSFIRIPMTSDEIYDAKREEDRKREIEDGYNYDPREDANSWMDDAENYWNID
jgi:hypothetical protein